jgi:hypothetical protein
METAGAATPQRAIWLSLFDMTSRELWRGSVFRITSAKWPYEQIVDLMCLERTDSPSGLSLMVCTGYKAGLTLVHLPVESKFREDARSLSVSWLKANWNRWIYPDCLLEDVLVIPCYPSNVCIEHGEAFASRNLNV